MSGLLSILKDFFNSINTGMNDRVSQPFYRTFIISWLIVNWKLIYFIFFVDELIFSEKTRITKFQYIIDNYSFKLSLSLNNLLLFCDFVIIPFFASLLFIYLLPRYVCIINKKHYKSKNLGYLDDLDFIYKNKESLLKHQGKIKLLENEISLSEQKVNIEKQQLKVKELESSSKLSSIENTQVENFKQVWDDDYNNFNNNNTIYNLFGDIITRITVHKGNLKSYYDSNINLEVDEFIPDDAISYLSVKDIIKVYNLDDVYPLYEFTNKGKYFANKYIDEVNKSDEFDF